LIIRCRMCASGERQPEAISTLPVATLREFFIFGKDVHA